MTRLGIWCVLWWAATACCLAAPKLELESPGGTGDNRNDTLSLETENEESILTQVRVVHVLSNASNCYSSKKAIGIMN